MNDNPKKAETTPSGRDPWNKGKLIGPKPPLKLKEIWAIRIRLQIAENTRDLALFNLALDSKLRGCDLVRLRVQDIAHGAHVVSRATVMQQKTGQPVRFELTEQTREAIQAWIAQAKLTSGHLLLGHTKLESTVRYLGIEVDDALEMAEQTEICSKYAEQRPLATVLFGQKRTFDTSCKQYLVGPNSSI